MQLQLEPNWEHNKNPNISSEKRAQWKQLVHVRGNRFEILSNNSQKKEKLKVKEPNTFCVNTKQRQNELSLLAFAKPQTYCKKSRKKPDLVKSEKQ